MRNIGPKSKVHLQSIGIHTHQDLAAMGSVEAYRQLKLIVPGLSIVMLYALEGALWDLHWNELPRHMKEELHQQAGYTPKKKHK